VARKIRTGGTAALCAGSAMSRPFLLETVMTEKKHWTTVEEGVPHKNGFVRFYFIGFEELYRRKTETKVSMYWISEGKIVAFIIGGFFRLGTDFASLSKEDQDKIKAIKPVKTPKMPKTEQTLRNYKAFLAEGYDIRTPSMDSKLYNLESRKDSVYVKDVVKDVVEVKVSYLFNVK
jgi:hypothetical protein